MQYRLPLLGYHLSERATTKSLLAPIYVLLLCTLASGCTSMKPLSEQSIRQLNHSRAAITIGDKPILRTFTPGNAALAAFTGGVGAAIAGEAMDRSRKTVADNLEDPAKAIAENLQSHTESLYSIHFVEPNKNPNYILTVSSDGWLVTYDPLAWGSFFLTYNASAALIKQEDKSIVASGTCSFNPKNENDLSYEELLSKETPTFANEVDRAITYCSQYFIAGMFSADGSPQHKNIALPPRLAYLENGPSAFPLGSHISPTQIEPIYWQSGIPYRKEERAREEKATHEDIELERAEPTLAKTQNQNVSATSTRRTSDANNTLGSGSVRTMTACKKYSEVFNFCTY